MIDLNSIRLFAGLGKDESGSILASAVQRRYGASETIIRAEAPPNHLVIVQTGLVNFYIETEDGHKILLRRFAPGNVFGIASFLHEPVGYLGTATAVGEVEALVWERRNVLRFARVYPRFSQNAFRLALHYIAVYAQRHVDLVSNTAQERLAFTLANTASRTGHVRPDGVEVEIRNEELASLADVGIFTACRLLKKWEHAGALAKSRGKVLIRCPELLLSGEIRPFEADIKHAGC